MIFLSPNEFDAHIDSLYKRAESGDQDAIKTVMCLEMILTCCDIDDDGPDGGEEAEPIKQQEAA